MLVLKWILCPLPTDDTFINIIGPPWIRKWYLDHLFPVTAVWQVKSHLCCMSHWSSTSECITLRGSLCSLRWIIKYSPEGLTLGLLESQSPRPHFRSILSDGLWEIVFKSSLGDPNMWLTRLKTTGNTNPALENCRWPAVASPVSLTQSRS